MDCRSGFDFTKHTNEAFTSAISGGKTKLLLDDDSKNGSIVSLLTTLKQVETVTSEAELFLDIGFESATSEGLAFVIFSDSIQLSEDHKAVANIHIFPCGQVGTFKLEDVTRLSLAEAPAKHSTPTLRIPN